MCVNNNGSGVNYVLWCSLCKKGYPSNAEWTAYLILVAHQELSLPNCQQWYPEMVECSLVIFIGSSRTSSSSPMSRVVNYFSELEGLRGGPVTDVVLNPENRNVAVLQFESRRRARRVLTMLEANTKTSPVLEGVPFEVKILSEYRHIERQHLFPWLPLPRENVTENGAVDLAPNSVRTISTPQPLSDNKESHWIADFREIRAAVEIPVEEFQQVLKLMERLQSILEKHFEGCQLFLFRHWYLRLRCPPQGREELLIYVRHDQLFTINMTVEMYEEIFKETTISRKIQDEKRSFTDNETGLDFTLVDYGYLLPEMLTCQLINHLCSLELPLVKALMMVVRYWALKNGTCFQKIRVTIRRVGLFQAPIPAALEIMVIFFLLREKHVKLPDSVADSPWDTSLEERLIEPGIPLKPDWMHKHHLEDPPEWENETFIKSIVRLAMKFFHFYGSFLQNEVKDASACILNPRDGDIILVERNGSSFHFRNLSGVKLTDNLKRTLVMEQFLEDWRKDVEKQAGRVKMPVSVLHPLYHINRFAFHYNQLRSDWDKMHTTANNLRRFLGNTGKMKRSENNMSWKDSLTAGRRNQQPTKRKLSV